MLVPRAPQDALQALFGTDYPSSRIEDFVEVYKEIGLVALQAPADGSCAMHSVGTCHALMVSEEGAGPGAESARPL